jgi:UDPglucose--hexose-1-phosphate uridylyltransferase
MTPPEVYSHRSPDTPPDSPGWRVRVVPNKFPALNTRMDPGDKPSTSSTEKIHLRIPGFGAHEIVIETPVKDRQMVDMKDDEIAEVLIVFRERMRTHFKDKRFKTVILFKNHGKEAGASLVHSHTQLMALPIIPNNVAFQLESFEKHQAEKNRCLMCEILDKEINDGARIVVNESGYIVLAPFAASSPFQLNIVPRDHSSDFSLSDDDSLGHLAQVLGGTLRRLRSVLGEHPWNMVLHNAPANLDGERDATAYHWFLEITPRLTNPAGFEMGSGFFINTVAPEECAALLRESGIQNPESRSQEKDKSKS